MEGGEFLQGMGALTDGGNLWRTFAGFG